jgi:hypothetical protein
MFGEDSAQVSWMRSFRDNVLSASSEGRAMIELYYRWNPWLVKSVEEDEELREEIRKVVESALLLMRDDSDPLAVDGARANDTEPIPDNGTL